MLTRTWFDVMREIEAAYLNSPPTLRRWRTFMRSAPVKALLNLALLQTENTHLLAAMRHTDAGVSTNKLLRILHNRALDLGWLLAPVLPRKLWPQFKYGDRRGITAEEHARILAAEYLDDYRYYYELLWVTGGSQTDIANLHSDDIHHETKRVHFSRQKLQNKNLPGVTLVIGPVLEALLKKLPDKGWLFPRLQTFREMVRSSHFAKVCKRAKVEGVCLHSYRYAWANRAKACAMPEREAMAHLGHSSKAVHRAYSRNAEVVTLPLEHYEAIRDQKIIQIGAQSMPTPVEGQSNIA